ncbi:DUF87 domain-containing protein [Actinokineospora auranticolor]|uniref:Uncharacterized protein DUF87 n=1 Tax=Actinokineospora auranticolor TaxID=155976 RepID=A0A2S6GB85_9PSEU|nr:DUF87 domain-containing protein [Actinokineospora auranticolor]PPK60998.1 uncharacterized protein DUF87 [Actinokineospora auranticolor]
MIEELAALATLRFDWADTPDHVWHDSPYHVDGLHADVTAAVDAGIRDAAASSGPSPIGLVLKGQKGVGKTHLLGSIRRQVHRAGGYFFLVNLSTGDAFWENTAEALRFGLSQPEENGDSQLRNFLRRVCDRDVVDPRCAKVLLGGHGLNRGHVDAFVAGLRALDRQVAKECSDAARALVLYATESDITNDIGEDYLEGFAGFEPGEWREWGIRRPPRSALAVVRDITKLLAMTGPVVICVDQLDTLIARTSRTTGNADGELLVAQVADGLMSLREITRRTLTVMACLSNTWTQISSIAADSVPDRFRELHTLGRVVDGAVGRALVEKRLGVAYEGMRFTPPHPSWPIAPTAFEDGWEEMTPRELLKRIGTHIEACLRSGVVTELASFTEDGPRPVAPARPEPAPDRFAELDARFARERESAGSTAPLDHTTEDDLVPRLLAAALRAWLTEVGDDHLVWERPILSNGHLHAQLKVTLDEVGDVEEYWSFRSIHHVHPISVLHRFRKARAAADLRKGDDLRHLVLIRNDPWSGGPKTQAEVREFESSGGLVLPLSDEDLKTFWALDRLLDDKVPGLIEWLVDRRPAGRSELLSRVLPTGRPESPRDEGTHPPPEEITLGEVHDTGEPVTVELSTLRKHMAVFAGSGSGKTVLLRRVIEECALRGVSSIVLDPNNDLARLGDPWPEPPSAWGPGDAALAATYLAETEVVVWTPGRATGRPLAFPALPDFAGVLDDEDEFNAAVEVAVATLAPQVRLTGSTAKADIGRAVLRQVVEHYARGGARGLPGLIDLLADLPDDVSTLNGATRVAADLAEAMKAAMVNDPLTAGGGEPVDPGVLLTPGPGKRARVSVISFVGLPQEAQRQNFVNQLQMELFAWAKRNPAGERPLGALFVMDEAQTLAASGTLTASTRSTIVLASQARKYGLGLLFATQAPKGLHNQVVGNATTQVFGRLGSPAQITAANELARAKGSPIADVGGLARAQFYVASESFGFKQVVTPLCLTHHPASPLRLEEVLDRARR